MKILRKPAVSEKTGFSIPHIDRLSGDPDSDFPEKIQIGPNAVGWYEDEIDAWLKHRRRGALAKIIGKPMAAGTPELPKNKRTRKRVTSRAARASRSRSPPGTGTIPSRCDDRQLD